MQFMASLVDAVCLVSGMTEATVVEMPKRTRGLQNLSKIEIQADAPFSSIYSIFSHSFKQKKKYDNCGIVGFISNGKQPHRKQT